MSFTCEEALALSKLIQPAANSSETTSCGYSLREAPATRGLGPSGEDRMGMVSSHPGGVGPAPQFTLTEEEKAVRSRYMTSKGTCSTSPSGGTQIWSAEEVVAAEMSDTRTVPEYHVVYTQHTDASDAYLGIDYTRDPSTRCSDAVVYKVLLPELRSIRDVVVDVKEHSLHVSSEVYRLDVEIHGVVMPSLAKASWDGEKGVLSINIPFDRNAYEVKIL